MLQTEIKETKVLGRFEKTPKERGELKAAKAAFKRDMHKRFPNSGLSANDIWKNQLTVGKSPNRA